MSIFLGSILALIVPLLFLGIIRTFDFYQTRQLHVLLKCLLWGMISFAPATIIYKALEIIWPEHLGTINHFVVPIYEELLKSLILLYLFRHAKITYSVDGALYGFAIGTGFAIVENFGYIYGPPSEATIVALQRVFSANLVHAISSAVIGISLGMFYSKTSETRWQVPVIGFLLAIGQHMLYNNIAYIINASDGIVPLGIVFVPGLPGIFFIRYFMQRGVKQSQDWIKEKLGIDNRMTQGEVSLIDRLTSSNDILFPVVERFGTETASKVEQLLYLQARLGIKRKSLDHVQNNEGMRNSIETEIQEMQTEMEDVRHSIGAYKMLFIRGLFTKEMVSVWEQMQAKIQERSAATSGQKGGGVWSSLEERLKS